MVCLDETVDVGLVVVVSQQGGCRSSWKPTRSGQARRAPQADRALLLALQSLNHRPQAERGRLAHLSGRPLFRRGNDSGPDQHRRHRFGSLVERLHRLEDLPPLLVVHGESRLIIRRRHAIPPVECSSGKVHPLIRRSSGRDLVHQLRSRRQSVHDRGDVPPGRISENRVNQSLQVCRQSPLPFLGFTT